MRNVIISCIIFVSMMFSIIFSLDYLNKVSIEILSLGQCIEEHIVDGNWELAYRGSMDLLNQWDDNSKIISLFTNDTDIHSLSDEIVKLTQYIKENSKDDSLVSTHLIKYFMNHIRDMQNINLKNTF